MANSANAQAEVETLKDEIALLKVHLEIQEEENRLYKQERDHFKNENKVLHERISNLEVELNGKPILC